MPDLPQFPIRIFFDGACVVCAGEVEQYRRRDRAGRLELVDISAADFDPLPFGIPLQAFQYELHVIDRGGTVYRGIEAFRAIWQAFPEARLLRLLAWLVTLPVVNALARLGYRCFARLRPYLPKRRAACTTAGQCRIGRN
jgi:predicted DCC family thiol-disulfide oxidoreductase YuxK